MPVELQPRELAQLVDVAERPRRGEWSLRSALVRYAQPEPERVGELLESVRRIEFALSAHHKLLEREGPAVWAAFESGAEAPSPDAAAVIGVLSVVVLLDGLADRLAEWAVDGGPDRPNDEVDDVSARTAAALDELGIAREDPRARPPGVSGR